ncbi:hypothetical protein EJ08DRAFT_578990 [Tothia fuscella]|uniref:Zn(2)-C6 fungal-type domain-containing protein n=1 Tax=Tothia fuscella TaxID=1048955 RepID=A0A9P4P2P1_9PEZI|nr:hypothetical protein EJ08DRAFT_578990 [Tothia fuscella]
MSAQTSIGAKGPRDFSKSRNGCLQCRSNRMKCDESKPHCKKCTSRAIICPGYKKSLKWSTKYEVFQRSGSNHITYEPESFKNPVVQPQPHARAEGSSTTLPPSEETGNFSAVPSALLGDHQCVSALSPSTDVAEDPLFSLPYTNTADTILSTYETSATLPNSDFTSEPTWLDEQRDEGYDHDYQQKQEPIKAPRATTFRNSKSLLRRFYHISSTTGSPRPLIHEASMLVEHYFKDVCCLYSSFDSALNPFRMSVANSWSNSAPIYYAIQSMAAAHLSTTYNSMESIGIELKRQANRALREEIVLFQSGQKTSDCALLVTLLLGLSACWHKSNDLGLGYLRIARMLMYPRLASTEGKSHRGKRQDQFFEEALIYWEMMMAFVAPKVDDPLIIGNDEERSPSIEEEIPGHDPVSDDSEVLPHPWTGVAPKVQMLFAEVAQLIRRERTAEPDISPLAWSMNGARRQTKAANLEEQLLAFELPPISALVDTGDLATSKEDFIIIAEATRCAALLEIYRVFPDNLQRRLGARTHNMPDFLLDLGKSTTAELESHSTTFLTSLALHIVELIAKLPIHSGTRFLQLMLLVVSASELRYASNGVNLDFLDLGSESLRIMNARLFAQGRLGNHAARLPAKPVRSIITLVKEVWRRLDLGEEVFWFDVMISNGWETVMG